MSEPISPDQYRDLDAAACEVARILVEENVHYLLVGGYATTLVSGNRMTADVDFVVDADPSRVRTLVAQYPDFELKFNNLFYKSGNKVVKVDTFDKDTFKMPDLANVYSKTFKPHHKPGRRLSVPLQVMHPTMIFMAKLRRWVHIAGSARPESLKKPQADEKDMETLLGWAINCVQKIDLDGYLGKPKAEFLSPWSSSTPALPACPPCWIVPLSPRI